MVMGALLATAGIAGNAVTTVEEAVTISQDTSAVNGSNLGFVTFKDDTAFNAQVDTFQGATYYLQLSLNNAGTETFDEVLTLKGPDGFEYTVTAGSNLKTSRKSENSYIVRVTSGAAGASVDTTPASTTTSVGIDELRIQVEVSNSVSPGNYEVTASLDLLKEDE